jgi:hypothetical protein
MTGNNIRNASNSKNKRNNKMANTFFLGRVDLLLGEGGILIFLDPNLGSDC